METTSVVDARAFRPSTVSVAATLLSKLDYGHIQETGCRVLPLGRRVTGIGTAGKQSRTPLKPVGLAGL